MPAFTYTARTKTGQRAQGVIEAQDRRAAVTLLEQQGLSPFAVDEKAEPARAVSGGARFTWWTGRRKRMSTRDVLTFTTELSDLLSSGMSLGNALNCLANRKTGRESDVIIAGLRDEIVRGASLSDALGQYPETFPTLYASMIKAGEASGALPLVLQRLVTHYERVQETKEKIVMALVYPLIVLAMGAGTLIFTMVYVIPKFEKVFEQLNATLPMSTQILISSSRFLVRYGIFLAIGIVIVTVLVQRLLKTAGGRLWWHGLQLRLPLIRGVVAAGTFANFARTLETLLSNGVPVLQALSIVEQTISNRRIAGEVRNVRERVTDGTSISGPLAAGGVFPPIMTDMLAIGEQTGDVPGALSHISRRYENELDRNLKIFMTALEPILILLIALVVGFVAVSIVMAVMKLTSGMGV
jgi:type II secretory pathway component PulF